MTSCYTTDNKILSVTYKTEEECFSWREATPAPWYQLWGETEYVTKERVIWKSRMVSHTIHHMHELDIKIDNLAHHELIRLSRLIGQEISALKEVLGCGVMARNIPKELNDAGFITTADALTLLKEGRAVLAEEKERLKEVRSRLASS